MDVLIETTPLRTASAGRGIGRYTSELIKSLRALTTDHKFYTSEDHPVHVDLVHYPFFDLFFPTLPLFKRIKSVVTIHDVIPLVMAKHYPVGIKGSLGLMHQKFALREVAHVITDSQSSKRDITEFLKVSPDKVTAIPLAASGDFYKRSQSEVELVRKKYGISKNYVLYVGDINYNKNLPFLISVMAKIPDISLVLVGRAMKNTAIPEGKAIAQAIEESGSEKFVRLLTEVESQEELAALYSGARVYVQPSLYEGFGLPVLEAMQCKTPVVSSKGGSLPELVDGVGLLFNPRDKAECEAAVRSVLRLSDEKRQAMAHKAFAFSKQFSWERTAWETLSVYEMVGK